MTTEVEQVQATKRCSRCFLEKTINEFYLSTRAKDGRQVKCNACEANYRIANKEAIKSRKAAYHILNREIVLEKLRQYRSKNAKRNREREKARYIQIKLDPEKYAKYREITRISKKTSNLRHHDSYHESQWLVVRWLCKTCHRSHHRKYPDQTK